MSEQARDELLELTQRLLDSIRDGDWETYQRLCDPDLTCFEPEGRGHLVKGREFHRFYFELGGHLGKHQSTIVSPHIHNLSERSAVISYVRLVQFVSGDGQPKTDSFEETRIWRREGEQWLHVHFHRSRPS